MSVKLMVEFKGKRQAISIAPMAPLQKVIEAVCFQQKPQLTISGCQLYYQKKLLDPTTPVRFANLPKEAKLELIADTAQPEQRLGLADQPTHSSPPRPASGPEDASTSQTPAPASIQELLPAQPASPSSMYLPMDTDPLVQPYSGAISHQQPVIATTCPAAAHDPIGSGRAAAAQIAAGHQSESASADASPKDSSTDASMAASSSDGSTKPVPTGFDRTIHVFTREAVAAAEASSRSNTELPPEFYDFTPDDYHKVMSGWAKQNSKAAGPMKTQKLREQDERRRAEQFGPIPVRLHFPDGSIVQANFKALDTLASLQKLVQQCMLPNLPQWYLYVTPPKQALKDLSLTFYKAGLLPAANVLVGMDSKHDGLFLKPEVAALQAVPPPRTVARQSNGAETSGTSKGNVGPSVQFLPSSKATGEKKVPKWMKLGK